MILYKAISFIFVSTLVLITLASGCATRQMATVIPNPTCSEILSEGIAGFSDTQLEEILDDALSKGRMEDCWIPVIKSCLKEQRDIPQRHLTKAVKVFNRQSDEKVFHVAVYRYLAAIAKGEGQYREQDRQLLEAYCRYMINNAGSREDENLRNAMLLCRRLDSEMYARLFE